MLTLFVTTYNRPHLLKKCLDSIAKQTDSRWEVLVADDNSSDPYTDGIITDFKMSNLANRVFHWNTRVPEGARADLVRWAVNINSLVAIAKGDFFMYLTDDSEAYPTLVEEVHKFFENPSHLLGYVGQMMMDANYLTGEQIGNRQDVRGNAMYGLPLHHAFAVVDLSQVAHRKELFVDFPTDRAHWHHADGLFFDDLITRFGPLLPIGDVMTQPLVIYKVTDSSVCRQPIEEALAKLNDAGLKV